MMIMMQTGLMITTNRAKWTTFNRNILHQFYLTNAKTHDIIIKLSHESES